MNRRHRVFARMWRLAVLAHSPLTGSTRISCPSPRYSGSYPPSQGVLATFTLIRPDRFGLVAWCAVVPVTAVLEALYSGTTGLWPVPSHLAFLLLAASGPRFEPAARSILVLFYAFAACAKLNACFLDPATSCGVFDFDRCWAKWMVGRSRRPGS